MTKFCASQSSTPDAKTRSVGESDLTQLPNVQFMPVDCLCSNPRNARTHSKKQIKLIVASIRAFGFTNPIVVDEDKMILAGHGRWEAARLDGLQKVPTVRLDRLTPAQKRAFVLADNKIAEQAGWDRELLAIELGELADLLPAEGLSIELTGFEAAEIDLVIADMAQAKPSPEDRLPGLPKNPVTQGGDIWLLGKHRLLCGDSRKPVEFTRLMNGSKAAAVFCDPPFNLRIRDLVGRGRAKHAEFAFASGEMSPSEFNSFLQTTLENGVQVSAQGAVHFVCMDWRHVAELIEVGRQVYGAMLNLVVWNKSNAGQGSFYRSQHELICVFRVGESSHQNNIKLGRFGRNRSNVWSYPGCNSFGRGRMDALSAHPTVKPVALVADALLDCTGRGDIVLDQFIGSGTTILSAEKVGRRCFGLEFEPAYVDVAIKRWQAMTKLEATLDGDGRTFDEIARERRAKGAASPAALEPGSGTPELASMVESGDDWTTLCTPPFVARGGSQ